MKEKVQRDMSENDKKDEFVKRLEGDIYCSRVLVFLETSPQSNKYKQFLFTEDEFKAVSSSIGTVKGKRGSVETVEVNLSDTDYPLPDLEQHL